MLKLIAVLFMVTIACSGFTITRSGSYKDRPELISDEKIQDLTSYAIGSMFGAQNPSLKNIKITRVQTQLVNGMNYKIDFTGEPVNGMSGAKTTCQVVIYVTLSSEKGISQSQCQTA